MKQKTETPVLEDEIKPMDIRNSVVWTGKIPEQFKEKDNENKNKEYEEKKEENIGIFFNILIKKYSKLQIMEKALKIKSTMFLK